ncbi:TIGR00725 family protein [Baekduia soli]|uniref:TIGR00725 family protein n=1 Tax=Baekduia soli TaxID=496014 RepID=A0A5B8UA28_9ACTN|nr:TIGR00725 family protein [Baekduia soli]QEC49668.1 TIGR00725 family protein [Baekduia soli]
MAGESYVAVVGSGEADAGQAWLAEEVGAALAEAGAVVVTGGLGGVMEAACRGAKSRRGRTLALLPGDDRRAANGWVDVAVATGLGELRNGLIVRSADAVIAIGGGAGTLSEIAFALKTGTPVFGLGTWDTEGIVAATDAADAVARAIRHASSAVS